MRKMISQILEQVNKRLLSDNEQSLSTNEQDAIKRIRWIAASFAASSSSNNPNPKTSTEVVFKDVLRSGKLDGDEKAYSELVRKNHDSLSVISPDSLEQYVGLLETPKS